MFTPSRDIVCECPHQYSTNTSGYKGVYHRKYGNKWSAKVCINYEDFSLGVFDSKIEAICHRVAAEQCLGFKYVQTIPTKEC